MFAKSRIARLSALGGVLFLSGLLFSPGAICNEDYYRHDVFRQ